MLVRNVPFPFSHKYCKARLNHLLLASTQPQSLPKEETKMTMLYVLWAVTGWCATVPVRIKITKGPPIPDPDSGPKPNWIVLRIIGVVSGVIGGFVFSRVFQPEPEPWLTAGPHPEPWALAVFAAATAVGAFVVARLVTDLYEQFSNRGR